MSKLLLTSTNQNGILMIASSEADLEVFFPNLQIHYKPQGCLHTISDSDFTGLNLCTKQYDGITDGAPVITDVAAGDLRDNAVEDMTIMKTDKLNALNYTLKTDFGSNTSFKNGITAYRDALESFDVSALTYPYTYGINKAFADSGSSVEIYGRYRFI